MNAMNYECCQTNEECENEWMNEWMRWDEDWFEFPAWEISSNFGRFHWFSLERNKPKVKQTDTLTEPLMLAQLKT